MAQACGLPASASQRTTPGFRVPGALPWSSSDPPEQGTRRNQAPASARSVPSTREPEVSTAPWRSAARAQAGRLVTSAREGSPQGHHGRRGRAVHQTCLLECGFSREWSSVRRRRRRHRMPRCVGFSSSAASAAPSQAWLTAPGRSCSGPWKVPGESCGKRALLPRRPRCV